MLGLSGATLAAQQQRTQAAWARPAAKGGAGAEPVAALRGATLEVPRPAATLEALDAVLVGAVNDGLGGVEVVGGGGGGGGGDALVVAVAVPAGARAKALGVSGTRPPAGGARCSGDAFAGCGFVAEGGGPEVRFAKRDGKPGVARLVLRVADVEASAAFYERLGAVRAQRQPGVADRAAEDPPTPPRALLLLAGGKALELREGPAAGGARVSALSIAVADVDAAGGAAASDPDGRTVTLVAAR